MSECFIDFDKVKQEAQGKWLGILRQLGIKIPEDGSHGPCPVCGGVDRFRFDDKEGRGTHICSHCGAGDGFELIKKTLSVEFKDAMKAVAEVVGNCQKIVIPNEPTITPEKLRKIFTSSVGATRENGTGEYLKNRGLSIVPSCLRYTEKCWEPEQKKECPAMLAVFTAPGSKALTMHRTFLNGNGGKADIKKQKKLLPALDKLNGGAIRLFPCEGVLGVAEGIETAIAAYEMYKIPVWSTVASSLMVSFEPPEGVKELHIFADNDVNFTGQQAAYTLARKIKMTPETEDIAVTVHVPELPGTDYLDELARRG